MATNVHFWALVEKVRKTGVQLVVIDPRRSQTAARADWHLPIRIGTDAALACGIVHILVRDGLLDRDYIAAHTLGFERWATEVLPNFPPDRVARDHRALRGRRRAAGGDVRRGQGLADPARRGHDAAGARRPGAARGGAAAGR